MSKINVVAERHTNIFSTELKKISKKNWTLVFLSIFSFFTEIFEVFYLSLLGKKSWFTNLLVLVIKRFFLWASALWSSWSLSINYRSSFHKFTMNCINCSSCRGWNSKFPVKDEALSTFALLIYILLAKQQFCSSFLGLISLSICELFIYIYIIFFNK